MIALFYNPMNWLDLNLDLWFGLIFCSLLLFNLFKSSSDLSFVLVLHYFSVPNRSVRLCPGTRHIHIGTKNCFLFQKSFFNPLLPALWEEGENSAFQRTYCFMSEQWNQKTESLLGMNISELLEIQNCSSFGPSSMNSWPNPFPHFPQAVGV